jgi:tetratricopeptide (TPR) repeat protein
MLGQMLPARLIRALDRFFFGGYMHKLQRTTLYIICLWMGAIFPVSCLPRINLEKYKEHVTAGNKSYEQGNYNEAEEYYQAALKEAEKNGSENEYVGYALFNLGRVYEAQGKYPKAEVAYRQRLAIAEHIWDSGHPKTLSALNRLADFYVMQGKLAEAESYNRKALAIVEKGVGTDPTLEFDVMFTKMTAEAISEQKRLKEIEGQK